MSLFVKLILTIMFTSCKRRKWKIHEYNYQKCFVRMIHVSQLPFKRSHGAEILSKRCRKIILPRLMKKSKECRGQYSTIYNATLQWIMRSDTHLSF